MEKRVNKFVQGPPPPPFGQCQLHEGFNIVGLGWKSLKAPHFSKNMREAHKKRSSIRKPVLRLYFSKQAAAAGGDSSTADPKHTNLHDTSTYQAAQTSGYIQSLKTSAMANNSSLAGFFEYTKFF